MGFSRFGLLPPLFTFGGAGVLTFGDFRLNVNVGIQRGGTGLYVLLTGLGPYLC